jgi:phosphate acetyltransferase
MAHNLYITAAESGSGKSVIGLAVMELLSGYAERVGIFRPVVRGSPTEDNLLRLIATRYRLDYPPEALYGVTLETARKLAKADRYDELLRIILDKFGTLNAVIRSPRGCWSPSPIRITHCAGTRASHGKWPSMRWPT